MQKFAKHKRVSHEHIANSLPVNTWFDVHTFTNLTGVPTGDTTRQRLHTLVKKELLTTKGRGKKRRWHMTDQQRAEMLTLHEEYLKWLKSPKGNKEKVVYIKNRDGLVVNLAAIEYEAYAEDVWRFLRENKLV